MKYLYGKVTVQTIVIEANTEDQAVEILKDTETQHDPEIKHIQSWALPWMETPDENVKEVRNGVLGEFLNLMQDVIPMNDGSGIIEIP